MDELIRKGFKAKSTFKEENHQFLAVLEIEGINESFSTYSNTRLAAKNAAANLAQQHITNNNLIASQLYANNNVFKSEASVDVAKEEAPNQMFRRLYPDVEAVFESVCIIRMGENEFQGRGESRGLARVRATASALETLNGVTFDLEKYVTIVKKEVKDSKATEKHPASALHEVVGHNAVFTFEEEITPGSEWKTFICNVCIDDKLFSGKAANKRLAKYNAALTALNGLGLTKRFRLMPPPVDNTPLHSDTGIKRRGDQLTGAGRFDTLKRGRGGPGGLAARGRRGGSISSLSFDQRLNISTPQKFDRGRERLRGRWRASSSSRGGPSSSSRGGPSYRGREQAVGDYSTASFLPHVMQEPGYGASLDPYPGYTDYSSGMQSYNQDYEPGYNSGFSYTYPTTTPPRLTPRGGRGRPYSQQRGNTGYDAYQY
ncbi:hypothetical protein LOD99_7681 [Oopsacas minuta]|uniref:DRBM domain-containing protein n=1 Tax=Oopsacas minuta TaxID=111878 RepID=A0AAV7JP80_9METZ|nr:hypothetical protein LOD99_7681 [Oopsacas minuta]